MTDNTRAVAKPSDLARVFREIRTQEFPWTSETTYLNAASIGPLPERTRRVVTDFATRRAQPVRLSDAELARVLSRARVSAARLIGARETEIGLATNTSFGLNVAAQSLPLEKGEIVILSDREFPANVYPWMLLEQRGVEVEIARTTPEGWPNEEYLLERVLDPRVRVLAISLVQFADGLRATSRRSAPFTGRRGAI